MIIELSHVSWERGDDTILKDINWSVKEHEHWCLLGLNGSGKTTLLNLINGYIWPTAGQINVLGHKFGEYDLRLLRKNIGWVSTSLQQKLHGSDKALEIVVSGKHATIGIYDPYDDNDWNKADALMNRLGCSHLKQRTYDTLSQGERQRVLIARALMNDPKLLILDEPCTGLDIFAREQLLHMISSIVNTENAPTLVYVTHHIEEILPCFTQTLLVKQGAIYAADQTEHVLASERMSDFFDVQVNIEKRKDRYWLSVIGEEWRL
ncbi:ABC transporter ATP-binding protein [Paenibacillus sp. GSMTC-2017]|uniref:ABC transporter ATP-binding protein n=1 Tax=Paenibacillus sp. GSMTC-2017 TaxID=2794350 RepID=UPI0018D8F1EA|nr:ABC transporter ATP-binding protein [Paenibacillus sp. GSMTC-2017]MBH5318109.1 ABC transporter ATP-binding protein [Paenibacillus sp. GSMTC-2017]